MEPYILPVSLTVVFVGGVALVIHVRRRRHRIQESEVSAPDPRPAPAESIQEPSDPFESEGTSPNEMPDDIDPGILTPERAVSAQRLSWHGPFLQPYWEEMGAFLDGASGEIRTPYATWMAAERVARLRDHTWSMLGKWLARRSVKVDRGRFDREVVAPVVRLAECLELHGIVSLRDLADQDDDAYASILTILHESLLEIAAIKPTKNPSVVFGSKVLHHYFPGFVPVFDGLMVRDGSMRTMAFQTFREEGSPYWIWPDLDEFESREEASYHAWFAFCAEQVERAQLAGTLEATCRAMGDQLHAFAPPVMQRDGSSLLWRLDAKAAEFSAQSLSNEEADEWEGGEDFDEQEMEGESFDEGEDEGEAVEGEEDAEEEFDWCDLDDEAHDRIHRLLSEPSPPWTHEGHEYRLTGHRRGEHTGYLQSEPFVSTILERDGSLLGEFVLIEHWQLTFNPNGHSSRYGFVQVTIQDIGQSPHHWVESDGERFRWNISPAFKKRDGRNAERTEAFRARIEARPDLAAWVDDRVVSSPFRLGEGEDIHRGLLLLAEIAREKFSAGELD